jgi:hypothetical protein
MKEIDNNIEMMYFHGETADGNRFTISGIIENEDLILGASVCAKGENFSKAKGRAISSGRVLNQRNNPHGRVIRSVYGLKDSSFEAESGGFPKDYYKGNELKIFREEVYQYNFFTAKELLMDFNLYRPGKI